MFGLGKYKEKSASCAKKRLMLTLSKERTANIPHFDEMVDELVAVVKKYTKSDAVEVKKAERDYYSKTLEITIDA
ncbi:hypothetical protein BKH43_02145 [Helicobacter sp. 13S00401-1]|uniref:cell division topological specificity factor MinE n=1 Tax=Helicobacter sp. 13S00401-1 TaxID=1905758 RepID=UPI000BA5A350|nr:cell division topological specificity factor MinE [Helicobacter sp. 13S00401-1]PAF51465.1 hypothetical protein BKH43_02145 [Helicobacter sp. 13S00401-1]